MLSEWIESFLRHIAAEKSYSENTVMAYRNDLMQFAMFLDGDQKTLTQDQVQTYIDELYERHYASSTIARKVAAIKSFLSYLYDRGVVTENIAGEIDTPKVERQVQPLLTRQQVTKLLSVPAKFYKPRDLRNQALLDLLYSTELKINELVDLKVQDFDGKYLRYRQSDGTEQRIELDRETRKHLSDYLENGRPALEKGKGDDAMFLNHRGQALSRQGLWLIIKVCAHEAGLPDTVTPNLLRRSFDIHQDEAS